MSLKNIYPSILDAPPDRIIDLFEIFKKHEISGIHIDVMDGNYVPSYGFNDRFIKWMNCNTDFYKDIHLMIDNPEQRIDTFIKAGADSVTVHYNTSGDIYFLISKLNTSGVKSGIALNPSEHPELIREVLPILDHVLVMTCSPGRPSNGSIMAMTKKVKWLDQYRRDNNLNYRIEVDGGINADNIKSFVDSGCDDFVSGGYLTKTNDIDEHIESLKELLS